MYTPISIKNIKLFILPIYLCILSKKKNMGTNQIYPPPQLKNVFILFLTDILKITMQIKSAEIIKSFTTKKSM